jgi:hypothetical protein
MRVAGRRVEAVIPAEQNRVRAWREEACGCVRLMALGRVSCHLRTSSVRCWLLRVRERRAQRRRNDGYGNQSVNPQNRQNVRASLRCRNGRGAEGRPLTDESGSNLTEGEHDDVDRNSCEDGSGYPDEYLAPPSGVVRAEARPRTTELLSVVPTARPD